jgi:hypothetical protein
MTLHSCAYQDPDTLFRELSPRQTGIHFANTLTETEDFNIIEYLYFYNGAGVAIGDINNDGLPDIFFTANQLPNKLYLNKGNLQFEDITEKAGILSDNNWKTGVTMADVNGDGWLDIYVCQVGKYKMLAGRNQLYINNQNGTFSEKAKAYGIDFQGFSTQAAFFDYDRDGDLDLYLLNHSVHTPERYNGADQRHVPDSLSGDKLFRNDGEPGKSRSAKSPSGGFTGLGGFTDVTAESGIYSSRLGYGLGIAVSDFDNNGWADIYVCNDFRENDYLYYNLGDSPPWEGRGGGFVDGTTVSLGHTSNFSMGCDAADFNNDGRTDLMTLDMKPEDETILKSSVGADPYNIFLYKLQYGYHYQYPRNMLQLNHEASSLGGREGAGFSEIGQLAGVDATDWSWSTLFCDLDQDGWKDIFVTNGIWRRPNDLDYLRFISDKQVQQNASDLELVEKMPSGSVPNYAFRNKGDLTFEKVSDRWGLNKKGCSNGAAYADLDNDGDLDLVTNNLNAPASVFENRANEKLKRNYLKIKLQDSNSNNKFGIGAKVQVTAGQLSQTQELYTTRGFQSSSEPVLTFGLDTFKNVSIKIIWTDGSEQTLQNIAVNQTLTVEKDGQERTVADYNFLFQRDTMLENAIGFVHRENDYNDFDIEKLLPHKLSTQGPKIAVGDVNGDGLEDFYICGAAGQAGELYVQIKNNQFQKIQIADFEKDTFQEAVDATFFDADNDGDLDLYVVTGGSEVGQPPEYYYDQLYINNGKGNFTQDTTALPKISANGSCVVAADFNADGAQDLFVGTRSIPGAYGLSPDTYILLNDGKGKFTKADIPELQKLGMVTDAVWLAKEKTLVVVGEWMAVTKLKIEKLRNSEITIHKSQIPISNGWWNTVHAADLDGDGDEDLLLGNAGLNSTLKASPQQPVELFVNDFDGNGSLDPILTYYKQNRRYTYASKDELFAQLISIKKKFVDYTPFANSTFEEVFDANDLKTADHRVVHTFASAIAENQGNGNFVLKPLPIEAQFAPIFAFATGDFNQDKRLDILAVGNWYDVQPSLGRYDASHGVYLQGDGKGNFKWVAPARSGFIVTGEGRDVKVLKNGNILVARNNAAVQVFQKQNSQTLQ